MADQKLLDVLRQGALRFGISIGMITRPELKPIDLSEACLVGANTPQTRASSGRILATPTSITADLQGANLTGAYLSAAKRQPGEPELRET